ncbi:MAG: DUF4149 domain-containing protein [Betaproteobacteria bacterium]|nr:DUF4149 domain-containing protein [Betaproteobacteria bacterium]
MGYLLKLFLPIWAGSLWWMIMVAKVLFDKIPTAFLAGIVAGQLFHYLSYFSLGMSVLIFFHLFKYHGWSSVKSSQFWLILFIAVIVLINFFGIQPTLEALKINAQPKEVMESIFADRFAMWHGISSISFLVQALLVTILMLRWR